MLENVRAMRRAIQVLLKRRDASSLPTVSPRAISTRVHLIVSGARVLPELDAHQPRLVDVAERRLTKGPLRIERNSRLAAATAEEAILDSGKRLSTRTIISCTGNARSPLLAGFPTEGPGGRIVTEPTMQVIGTTDTWAAGDCAAVPFPGGGTTRPLAIYAMMAGRQLGKNLRAVLRGKQPRPYRFTGLGDACTLGGGHAVAHFKGFPLTGRFAWVIWRCFMIIYLPARERKLRVIFDWLLQPWFGRDVLDLKVTPPVGLGSARYEKGQTIVREGDVGRSLFVIRSGEVEVVKATSDGPVVIATLREGDHFGEAAVFRNARRNASVVARTAVELLVLRSEAVQALDRGLPGFRERLPVREPGVEV
ncbi:cyclic nucleotide-binding domain-containing protein [Nibricoccus aquaticus]|nr:cyclic nucleotide-binding domain-containing protein [Nibricoccus aquaticus]